MVRCFSSVPTERQVRRTGRRRRFYYKIDLLVLVSRYFQQVLVFKNYRFGLVMAVLLFSYFNIPWYSTVSKNVFNMFSSWQNIFGKKDFREDFNRFKSQKPQLTQPFHRGHTICVNRCQENLEKSKPQCNRRLCLQLEFYDTILQTLNKAILPSTRDNTLH